MRGTLGSAVVLLAAALLLLRPWETLPGPPPGAAAARARVVRVVDGDTIEVRIGADLETVRLIGVDTPETVDPDAAVGCFGPRASRFSHRLLSGRRVRLVYGVERRDVYGRLLSYVDLGKVLVNAERIRLGVGRTLTIAPNDRFAERFKRLEIAAGRAGKGLWGACET